MGNFACRHPAWFVYSGSGAF